MSDKVKVISQYDGRCGIDNADLRISRRWPARGSHVMFDKDVLEELTHGEVLCQCFGLFIHNAILSFYIIKLFYCVPVKMSIWD